jgi:hypothetical protein
MKVKLLKIIRKRYEIFHYPDGAYFGGEWISVPFSVLIDNRDSWRCRVSHLSKELAYQELTKTLRFWVEKDYKTSRKRKNYRTEKLWHK